MSSDAQPETFSALAARVAGRLGIEGYRPHQDLGKIVGPLRAVIGESPLDFSMRVVEKMADLDYEWESWLLDGEGFGSRFHKRAKVCESIVGMASLEAAILAAADRALAGDRK